MARASRRLASSGVGQVGLVEHEQLGHVVGADLAAGRRARRPSGPRGRPPRRRPRGRAGRPRPPRRASTGRPRTSWWGSLRTKPTVSVTQHPLAAGQVEAAGGGVDGGEQAVLDQHAGVGEAVEQGRLAGVGVADDGDRRQPGPGPGLALGPAVLGQLLEVGLELGDPPQQAPAVDLELGLAAADPGADAAGLLAEALALAPQPGQAVAEHGPARPGPCPPGCGRAGRRCRGSRRCGRWPCGRGSSPGCGSGPATARRRR